MGSAYMLRAAWISIVCLVGLSGCITTADFPEIGTAHRESIPLGRYAVPLPEGEWEFVAKYEGRAYVGLRHARVVDAILAQRQGDEIVGFVQIRTNADSIGPGAPWPPLHDCRLRNLIHLEQVTRYDGGRDEECWVIDRQPAPRPNAPWDDVWIQGIGRVLEDGGTLPDYMLSTGHQFTSNPWFLRVWHLISVPLAAFDAPKRDEWTLEDWRVDRIEADQERSVFLTALKDYAAAYHAEIKAVFDAQK